MPSTSYRTSHSWLSLGLFLTTAATLLVEILDSRLLSVLTWYHLSFFAVSLAMLGMAAGAVAVFLGGARFEGANVRPALARTALWFAIAIPISHVITLVVPLPSLGSAGLMAIVSLGASTLAMTVPFFLSGVVVTLALTRAGGRIGVLYGWDLAGAAGGALLVVPLLDRLSLTSAFILAGAAAGAGAWCFARFAGAAAIRPVLVSVVLIVAGLVNGGGNSGLGVRFSKDRPLPDMARVDLARWNSHSFIVVEKPRPSAPFYWGPGTQAQTSAVDMAFMVIDGEAATALTGWNGDRAALDWVKHDVTVAPYYLRRGQAAIIGVGGGRDILSALWGGNTRVVGVEINSVLLDVQRSVHRRFAGLADDPAVTFVHDEARSYFTRTTDRFDVLQMSLIDTWAATGAGAFTLTENGLYTREAWKVFLDALTPTGVFSVSRWFNPSNLSESNRLLSLGVASLLDRGVADPRQHVVMLSRLHVATLMVSPSPFTADDRVKVERLAADEGFDLLITPWAAGKLDRLERIAASRSLADLDRRGRRSRPRLLAADRRTSVLLQPAQAERHQPAALAREHRLGQPGRDRDARRTLRDRRGAGAGDHPVAASAGRPSGDERRRVRGSARVLRDHRLRLHVRPDSVPAAVLGAARSSDVHLRHRPGVDDLLHRRRQFPVRAPARKPARPLAADRDCRDARGDAGRVRIGRRRRRPLRPRRPLAGGARVHRPAVAAAGLRVSARHAPGRTASHPRRPPGCGV